MSILIHISDTWWRSFSEIFLFQREQHRQKHLNPGSLLNWADGVIGLTPQTNSIKYFRRSNTNWIIFLAKFSSHIWKSDSVQLFLLRLCSMCRYLTRRGLIIGIGIRKCTEQPGSSLPLSIEVRLKSAATFSDFYALVIIIYKIPYFISEMWVLWSWFCQLSFCHKIL